MAEVLRNKEADTLIDFFEKIFKEYKFMYVVSDNEPALTSEKLEEFFNTQGVYHQTSVPYCPQSNGQVERRIGMINKKIARFVLEGECVRNAVTKSLNAMNYFASTSFYVTPAQKYFTGTVKWVRSHDFRYSKLILDWRFYKKRPTGRPRERYLNMYQKKKQFGVASTKSHTNLGSLKKALKKAWKEMSMEIVTNACKNESTATTPIKITSQKSTTQTPTTPTSATFIPPQEEIHIISIVPLIEPTSEENTSIENKSLPSESHELISPNTSIEAPIEEPKEEEEEVQFLETPELPPGHSFYNLFSNLILNTKTMELKKANKYIKPLTIPFSLYQIKSVKKLWHT
uniref:Integrase catalytic domain-containing protein n=1 Tax=Rhabditophanes sp. KR3021 TaxID=114890 RepID=A0AC35UHS1_9BILA